MNLIICVVFVLIIGFVFVFINTSCAKVDNYGGTGSYSFGFPTHGSYDYGGGPLKGWPSVFMRQPYYTYTGYSGWGLPYYGDYY